MSEHCWFPYLLWCPGLTDLNDIKCWSFIIDTWVVQAHKKKKGGKIHWSLVKTGNTELDTKEYNSVVNSRMENHPLSLWFLLMERTNLASFFTNYNILGLLAFQYESGSYMLKILGGCFKWKWENKTTPILFNDSDYLLFHITCIL